MIQNEEKRATGDPVTGTTRPRLAARRLQSSLHSNDRLRSEPSVRAHFPTAGSYAASRTYLRVGTEAVVARDARNLVFEYTLRTDVRLSPKHSIFSPCSHFRVTSSH
jgi:hypothetical protein